MPQHPKKMRCLARDLKNKKQFIKLSCNTSDSDL